MRHAQGPPGQCPIRQLLQERGWAQGLPLIWGTCSKAGRISKQVLQTADMFPVMKWNEQTRFCTVQNIPGLASLTET